jgi:predicted DCC family thiol-disulfide oxidoreductase YuxK
MHIQSSRYTLLYDGACRICTGQIATVAAYNDADLIEILDLRSPEVRERFPQITPEAAQRELHLVAPDGSLYRGAEAVRETLLRLPSLRGLGEVMRLPGVIELARPIYAFIAANRYLLGGRTDAACSDGTCAPQRTSRAE